MDGRELLCWVSSQLHSATAKDLTKDFCDGTVFMELAALLVKDEAAISEALANFTETPSTMFQSLENIKSVFKCLTTDGLIINATPLDVFRGRSPPILQFLQALHAKYESQVTPPNKSSLSREDITNWTKSVREHTEGQCKQSPDSNNMSNLSEHSQLSDDDTGFIDLTASDEETEKPDLGIRKSLEKDLHRLKYSDSTPPVGTEKDQSDEEMFVNEELPDPRPHDESYCSIDIIEVEEYLVRADTRIILTTASTQRACVFVSIPMRSKVTDHAARQSFIQQAVKNYHLQGCELTTKELYTLQLGYTTLLATCSYSRSLRTGSVGIYSPFLLGLCTINISDKRQLFAHTVRERITFSCQAKQECVKLTMRNVSKMRITVILPEGSVFEQQDYNGDSHLVTTESIIRTLDCEETEIINISSLYLNKHGGGARSQKLNLTPFVFRGPIADQEKLFTYSDPGLDGHFRFCNNCHQSIMRDAYGVLYYKDKPYHLACGPPCTKCRLVCLCLTLNTDKPYCSLECQFLSSPNAEFCQKCGIVLDHSDERFRTTHFKCPRRCKVCDIPCFEDGGIIPSLCCQLCKDWDTSKNAVCQGCAQPIRSKSQMTVVDEMNFHSPECVHLRQTAPPLILQRAMVRGRGGEVKELRRLSKLEFEKRAVRRREGLKRANEQSEQVLVLDGVMACINNIEANNDQRKSPDKGSKKHTIARSTDPLRGWNKSLMRARSRSFGADEGDKRVDNNARKRTNLKQPASNYTSDNESETSFSSARTSYKYRSLPKKSSKRGSFLDLLFCTDDEEDTPTNTPRPCHQYTRSKSERNSSRKNSLKSTPDPLEFEKKKLNRGFPTGKKDPTVLLHAQLSCKQNLNRSTSDSDTCVLAVERPINKSSGRFSSLRRHRSGGSSSTSSSSPTKVEFERPNLFDQLRLERVMHESNETSEKRIGRHDSAPVERSDVLHVEEKRSSDWEKKNMSEFRQVQPAILSVKPGYRRSLSNNISTNAVSPTRTALNYSVPDKALIEDRQRGGVTGDRPHRASPSGDRQRASPSGDRQIMSLSRECQRASPSGERQIMSPSRDCQRASPSRDQEILSPSRDRQTLSPSGDYRAALSPIGDQPKRGVSPDQIHYSRNKSPTYKNSLNSPDRKPISPRSPMEFDPISMVEFGHPGKISQKSTTVPSRHRSLSVHQSTELTQQNVTNHQRLIRSQSDESSGSILDLLSCPSENKYSLDMITDNGPGSWTTPRIDNAVTITMPGSRESMQSTSPVPTVALRLANDKNSNEEMSLGDFHENHFKRMSAQTVV